MIRKCHQLLPFRFPFSVSRFPLLRTHSLLQGWVRPQAKSGKLRRPRPAYTEAPHPKNRSDPSNHAQTPRAEGSGIYCRSDCMRRSIPTRRLPLRNAGRGAAPVVCVAGCFPALPALFAVAATSTIPFNLQLSACNQRSHAALKPIEAFL